MLTPTAPTLFLCCSPCLRCISKYLACKYTQNIINFFFSKKQKAASFDLSPSCPKPKKSPQGCPGPPRIPKNYPTWVPKGCLVPPTPCWSPGNPSNPVPRGFKTFLRFSFISLGCSSYLGVRRPPCSTQGADAEVWRPSHPVALA